MVDICGFLVGAGNGKELVKVALNAFLLSSLGESSTQSIKCLFTCGHQSLLLKTPLFPQFILGPCQKHWLGCFQNSEYWGFLSHKGPTHSSLHFPSHSSWFYSFIYFKVQFVMQLEDCQQGRVKWKVYFFSPVGKSWKSWGLLVGGSLDLFGLFFSRTPSLWENKVLLFSLSAKPKVEKLKIWFKFFFFFNVEQMKENSDAVCKFSLI